MEKKSSTSATGLVKINSNLPYVESISPINRQDREEGKLEN